MTQLNNAFLCRFGLSGAVCVALLFSAAHAQLASERADTRHIPRVAASNNPTVGEVVMTETGEVGPQFKKVQTCNMQGCRVLIYDKRTGALIGNDGQWSPAYQQTGVGREVIRVKQFSNAERPRKTPPSDKPLKTAPRIRVREVPQENNE